MVVVIGTCRPAVMDRRIHEEAMGTRLELGELALGMGLRVARIEQRVPEIDVDVVRFETADDPRRRLGDRRHLQMEVGKQPLERGHIALEQVVGLLGHGCAVELTRMAMAWTRRRACVAGAPSRSAMIRSAKPARKSLDVTASTALRR